MFTIAIHFYILSCECEPRVYEFLVDVLSTQCVKSFNRAVHSALHGQYGKPKFRAKQACLNLQHKISSHHLVHFNDTQRSSSLLPILLFIFTLLWTFFQSWYDWLMFRGVGQLRCWCRVRGNSVANHFGVNVSTIERLVRRLRETGHLADRPRSGRPRVTSRRQDRTIRLAHLRNRHLTATETALNTVGTHNRQISPKTVGSRLREIGLRARRPYVGLPLTQARRCVVWRGWRRMRPGYFRWGSGDEFFLRTSLGSLSIAQMVDVVCTDVAGNALPTSVLSNGIGLGVAPLKSGEALLTG